MIKLIIFDLWGTLAYKDIPYSSSSRILKEMNLNISRDEFIKIYEKTIQTKRWDSKFEAYTKLCKNIGVKTDKKNIDLIINLINKVEQKRKLYPHSIKILKNLKNRSYKIGLITNTSVFAFERINKKYNLLNYIDYPMLSFDTKILKPNPRIFKLVLKKAKCEPEEAIMIGNNLNNDIIPAKKLGINAIHFKGYKQLKKDMLLFSVHL